MRYRIFFFQLDGKKTKKHANFKHEKENIDEYYCGCFLPDGRHIVVGGKYKNRKEWSLQDDDNHVMPCPLKVVFLFFFSSSF